MSEFKFSDPADPKRRVIPIAERIIYVKEVQFPNPETVSEGAREVTRLSEHWDKFSILVDFPHLVVPDSPTRHRVCSEILPLVKRLEHVAVVTQANAFMRVTIKFVARASGFKNISVHKTRESAVAHLMTLNATTR